MNMVYPLVNEKLKKNGSKIKLILIPTATLLVTIGVIFLIIAGAGEIFISSQV